MCPLMSVMCSVSCVMSHVSWGGHQCLVRMRHTDDVPARVCAPSKVPKVASLRLALPWSCTQPISHTTPAVRLLQLPATAFQTSTLHRESRLGTYYIYIYTWDNTQGFQFSSSC